MNTYTDKAASHTEKPGNNKSGLQLQDNRPASILQKKQVDALANKQNNAATLHKKANTTGLPDTLKSGIENLSGHSMDDVKVHYNSSQPAQLNAHAYAQGTDIHLASGQEKHLPHEAWHVVQQKQGRVKPTMQLKGKVSINDDAGLEKEADVMGAKALQMKSVEEEEKGVPVQKKTLQDKPVAQRTVLSKVLDLKKGGTQIVYYSTHAPNTHFDDQFKAWELDTRLAKKKNKDFDEEARYPTAFTHYNTPSRNIPPSNSKAGPHTLSHSSVAYRLSQKLVKSTLKRQRDHQVPDINDFLNLLMTEAPAKLKQNQIQRLLLDYEISYKRLDKIINGAKENYEGEGHELLMRLIQLNPYTVYGKGKTVSHSRISGKGEKKDDDFDTAFDNKAKFNSDKNYGEFKGKRKRLFEDSDDEFEKKPAKKRKINNNENDELSPIDVMILMHRTARGALYIMNDDDWNAYRQYKKDNPEKKYSR